jgi:uncharacterized protein
MMKDSTILTYSGQRFDVLNPQIDKINILDIAHACANTCRYSGQGKFYSVGQHSVLIADYILKQTSYKALGLAALLHDASEAYLTDVPSPFKSALVGYKEIESKVLETVFRKFNLRYPYDPLIKTIDTRIRFDEKKWLMPDDGVLWNNENDFTPLDIKIKSWQPRKANLMFLERFLELTS